MRRRTALPAIRPALLAACSAAILAGCGGDDGPSDEGPPDGTYTIEAAFDDPVPRAVGPRDPVRIAGVEVGAVTDVDRSAASEVVVELRFRDPLREGDTSRFRLREDAAVRIRPRIFREGDYFLDLVPGTPGAEPLPDGARIPASRTRSGPP